MRKGKAEALLLCTALTVTAILAGCRMEAGDQEPPTVTAPVAALEETETSAAKPSGGEPEKGVGEISAPHMKPEQYPKVDGSTATLPLSQALYQLVTGATAREAETAIEHTKTTNAYNSLIYQYGSDLVLAYEPAPSVYDLMKEMNVKLNIKPIGKDALVFMANEGNPVRSLTGQQIKDIYSGRSHHWSDVGGPGKYIEAFQRPDGSGSQTLMDKLVMQGTAMDPEAPISASISEMGELIEKVASYNNQENALGYSVYFYARNMYEKPGLRFMAVDGVMPDNKTIKNGTYPYVNEFYAAIREDEPEDSAAHILFDWLTTDDGQTLVESLGYVGLVDVENTLDTDFSDSTVVGDARIEFTDQERFLIDGDYAFGTEGVIGLDGNMNVVEKINNVRIPSSMEMADITKPVIMEDIKKGLCGLYDLQDHTWTVQPVYETLYYDEEGRLNGYLSTETGDKRVLLTVEENGVKEELVPDNRTGSHIWNLDREQDTAVITDQDGNVVKTLDFKEYMRYQYGYVIQNYFLACGYDEEFTLFDEYGEPVLNQNSLENGRKYNFGTMSLDGRWMQGNWRDTGDQFIYDMVQSRVVTGPEDTISVYITDQDSFYVIENKDGITVHRTDGSVIMSDDGHPFEYVLDGGYFGYSDGDRLILEGGSPKKRFNLPVKNLMYGHHLFGDVFYLAGDTGSGIYQGETSLMIDPNCNWWPYGNYYVLDNGGSRSMVLDKRNGKVVYESNDGSQIIRPYEKFLVISRGNYLCVIDYEGRYALKQLFGYMTSD